MAVTYQPSRPGGGAAIDTLELTGVNGQNIVVTSQFEGDLLVVPSTAFRNDDTLVRAAVEASFPGLVEGVVSLSGNFGVREGRADRRVSPTFPA